MVVSELIPPGGPVGSSNVVIVKGVGFASYGSGQLVCRAGGTIVPGTLLEGGSVRCSLPAVVTPQSLSVSVSLNGGGADTFPATGLPFVLYAPPTVSSVTPSAGSADGGTHVTLRGSGFIALSTDATLRASYLRCRFGGTGAAVLVPLSHNESVVVCRTAWGEESPGGQLALVSLNGGGVYTGGTASFEFQGLHPPALVDTYFTAAATSLVIKFDSQPTNRGGSNGVVDCSTQLDERTALQLRGSSPSEAQCYWSDETTLLVQLTLFTDAAPGMAVALKPGVIWPALWSYPGSCDAEKSLCSNGTTAVNVNHPCDQKATPEVEACVQPSALVQSATEISACPGTALTLDGSRSSGGGIKPMVFAWSAHPTKTDKYFAVQGGLDEANGAQRITLRSELDDGHVFIFLLVVTNFLGQSSAPYTVEVTRATMAIPMITIQVRMRSC